MSNLEKLYDFLDKLNDNGKHFNLCALDAGSYPGFNHVEVFFNKKHRELYNKILIFCAENNMTIVSTSPATLGTVIRVSTTAEA